MNEIVKTFIRQVKGETYSPIGLSTRYGMQKMYGMSELELQNFAELIIQECIDICDHVQLRYGKYTFTANVVKDDIIARFGVEK